MTIDQVMIFVGMASSCLEYQALVHNSSNIVNEIQHSVNTLSDKCLEKALVTEETSRKILEQDSTSADKARRLLNNVKTAIKSKPELFEEFVTILKEDQSHECLGETLRIELQDLKDRKVHTQYEATPPPKQGPEENIAPNEVDYSTFDSRPICSSIEETQQVYAKRKAPTPIDYAMKDLTNAMENLKFAKLDDKEREARLRVLKKELRGATKENAQLKEDISRYIQTISELKRLLEEKEEALRKLENKVAVVEKRKHELVQEEGELHKRIACLHIQNSEQSMQIQQILAEKTTLQCNLNMVVGFLRESEDESKQLHALEEKYASACEKHEEILTELGHEQNTSRHMYSMFQDQIRRNRVITLSTLCFAAVVVLVFATVIILFAYCLEDTVNHNTRQCTRTVLNIATEYYNHFWN